MKKNIDERYDNRFISLYGIASSKTIEYKKEKIDILEEILKNMELIKIKIKNRNEE